MITVLAASSPTYGQSLPEIARQHGGTASSVISVNTPVSPLRDVVMDSDLIVRGQITKVEPQLTTDQSTVETVYTIRPIEVLKDARSQRMRMRGSVSPIVVRHAGGRLVTEDGLHLATSINDLPEAEYFALSEEVLVMLTYHAYTQAYEFAHGTFGAFSHSRWNGGTDDAQGDAASTRRAFERPGVSIGGLANASLNGGGASSTSLAQSRWSVIYSRMSSVSMNWLTLHWSRRHIDSSAPQLSAGRWTV